MNDHTARFVLALTSLLTTALAAGCGASDASSASAPRAAAPVVAAGGACGLLTEREVRAAIPEARVAKPIATPDSDALTDCEWLDGNRKLSLLVVRRWKSDGSSASDELKGLGIGLVDPLRSGAEAALRVESRAGIGDQAALLVERADEKRGILSNAAMLIAKKNGDVIFLGTPELASGERQAALERLATLGQRAVARL